MCSLLAKRFSSHFFSPSPLYHLRHHHHNHNLAILSPLLGRHLSTQPLPAPQTEMPFLAEYLISSLGFSPDRAVEISTRKRLKVIKSPDRPDAVIKFLRETGLSDAQIAATVSFQPILLGCNVDKTLKPNARELIAKGFSGEVLAQLIRYNPNVLLMKDVSSRLMFWRDFISDGDRGLLKIIPRIRLLMLYDVDKHIVPRLRVLEEYGLSHPDMVGLLGSGSRCMNRDSENLRQTIELIEELGFARESSMFLWALKAVGSLSKDKIQKKVEFYQTTYGWSKEEVYTAFRKFPYILGFSEEKIKSNMDFLTKKAKLDQRSIAFQPLLLGFSLEKRLVPRHRVVHTLIAKGLRKNCSLLSACTCSEKSFFKKYIEPYKEAVPELAGVYFAASGRKVSV